MQRHDTGKGRYYEEERVGGIWYAPLIAALTGFSSQPGDMSETMASVVNAIETVYHAFCVVVNRIA